jgi:hypothetical protein
MNKTKDVSAVRRLGRNVLKDSWTFRVFLALIAFDMLFTAVVAAKALAFIWFAHGIGNLIIAGQFTLVVLVLIYGWWRYLNAALASLVLVSSILAALKVFKFHSLLSTHFTQSMMKIGVADSTAVMIGIFGAVLIFGTISIATLVIGWRASDPEGRAAIGILGAGFVVTASAAIISDAIAAAIGTLTSIHPETLSRSEQGIELISVSVLLALTVGVVRVGWQHPATRQVG